MFETKTNWPETPMIPVAWGEVFDKLTILEIKLNKINDPSKKINIEVEKKLIEGIIGDINKFPSTLIPALNLLRNSNTRQWEIQEGLRECERQKSFNSHFLQLVRDEYTVNDDRAKIKRKINEILGSKILEEKSYAPY